MVCLFRVSDVEHGMQKVSKHQSLGVQSLTCPAWGAKCEFPNLGVRIWMSRVQVLKHQNGVFRVAAFATPCMLAAEGLLTGLVRLGQIANCTSISSKGKTDR